MTAEQFVIAYNKLPERVRMTLFDDKTTDEMGYIQEKHKLSSSQINSLARVVGLTMLGYAPIKDFLINIKSEVELEDEKAKYIAQEINERIFQPVREELLQVHGISEQGEQVQVTYEPAKLNAQTTEFRTAPMATPEPIEEPDAAAKQKREELLARLRAAQEAPIQQSQSPAQPQEPHSVQPSQEPPKAVTTAWNGKTIDLSMIPPRRQLNGNGKKNGEEEVRTVQLKKGPDGYWYEV